MADLDLDALAELERKATEGPWNVYRCDYCKRTEPESACGFRDDYPLDASYDECHHTLALADAALIVSLRNHARTLIAEARRAREYRDELLRLRAVVCADDVASIDALLRREDERG